MNSMEEGIDITYLSCGTCVCPAFTLSAVCSGVCAFYMVGNVYVYIHVHTTLHVG